MGYGLWVMSSGFWVLGCVFWVVGCGFWVLGSGFYSELKLIVIVSLNSNPNKLEAPPTEVGLLL